MPKFIASLAAFLCVAGNVFSQWDNKTEIRELEFTLQTANHFYTWSDDIKVNTNYYLHVMSNELSLQKLHNISYAKMADIVTSCSAGTNDYLYIVSKDIGDLYAIDEKGEILTKKSFPDEKSGTYGAWLSKNDNGTIAFVQSQKVDKLGFSVSLLNAQLEPTWTKAFEPEKGQMQAKQMVTSGGKILVLYESKKTAMSSSYELRLKALSADGTEAYDVLVAGEQKENATISYVDSKGNAWFSGYYGEYTNKSIDFPGGAFSVSVSPDGVVGTRHYIEFKVALPDLVSPSDIDEFPTGQIAIFIPQQFTEGPNGIEILGETCMYDHITAAAPVQGGMPIVAGSITTLYDIIIWNVSANKIHRIHKPKRKIEIRNMSLISFKSTMVELKRASEFSIIGATQDKIYFTGWNRQFQYVSHVLKSANEESSSSRVFYGKPILGQALSSSDPKPMIQVDSPRNYVTHVLAKYELGQPLAVLMHSGACMFTPGKLVLYEYNNYTYQFQSKTIQPKF